MSAEFNTTIRFEGTKKEYIKLLELLRFYSDERYEQYMNGDGCWYLDEDPDDFEVTEDIKKTRKTKITEVFDISGPYGIFFEAGEIDLFERIADEIPNSSLEGTIQGWDVGGDYSVTVKLKNGLMEIQESYEAFGYEEDYESEAQDDINEDDDNQNGWVLFYDPFTHKYLRKYRRNGEIVDIGNVIINIDFIYRNGVVYNFTAESSDIRMPLNIDCDPKKILDAQNINDIVKLIIEGFGGKGCEEQANKLLLLKDQMVKDGHRRKVVKIEFRKTYEKIPNIFFCWVRFKGFTKMRELAENVCKSTENDKTNNINKLKEYINSYTPCFPYTNNSEQWPVFMKGKKKYKVEFDWRGLATNLEEFAKYVCSDEETLDYAKEMVEIDFENKKIKQLALYMPGGPEKKTIEEIETQD